MTIITRTSETASGWEQPSVTGGTYSARIDEERLAVLLRTRWYPRWALTADLHEQLRESERLAEVDPEVKPLTPEMWRAACRFVNGLPQAYPPPDAAVLPTGELSFNWFDEHGGNLAVILVDESTLVFSSLWADHDDGGVLKFGPKVPDRIISELRELY